MEDIAVLITSVEAILTSVVENWDTVAVATVVLAMLTGLLAYFTMLLTREARKTREQQLEPNIVVTIEPSNIAALYAFLIIENVGHGVAYDAVIKECENLTFNDDKNEFILNNLSLMNLKVLKSGQKIEHLLGKFTDLPSRTFSFDIVAKNAVGREVRCSNKVDVNCYFDRKAFNEKGMNELVDVIKQLDKNFQHVLSGFRKLHVNTFNSDDREEERKIREEQRLKPTSEKESSEM